MCYYSEVLALQNAAVDKSDNQKLLSQLVLNLQQLSVTAASTRSTTSDYDFVKAIRDYIFYIRGLKININEIYDSGEIDKTINQLSNLIPTPPTRNAMINSLTAINSKNPITYATYNKTMKDLENIYGNSLDINAADDVIRDFIKSNGGN